MLVALPSVRTAQISIWWPAWWPSCQLKGGGAVCKCVPGYSGKDCNERVCGSQNSFFNPKISKCNCELGFTCCSKEGSAEEKERDAELEMLSRENSLLMAKVRMAKAELAQE